MEGPAKKPAAGAQEQRFASAKVALFEQGLAERQQQQQKQRQLDSVSGAWGLTKPACGQHSQTRDIEPAKVFMADCVCAAPALDPSVPVKKRVPEWAL
jgi:hypothetical protein